MHRRHDDCRTSTAAPPTTRCIEDGHVARTDTTEGQALRQPGRAKEVGHFCGSDRHLPLVHDDDIEELQK